MVHVADGQPARRRVRHRCGRRREAAARLLGAQPHVDRVGVRPGEQEVVAAVAVHVGHGEVDHRDRAHEVRRRRGDVASAPRLEEHVDPWTGVAEPVHPVHVRHGEVAEPVVVQIADDEPVGVALRARRHDDTRDRSAAGRSSGPSNTATVYASGPASAPRATIRSGTASPVTSPIAVATVAGPLPPRGPASGQGRARSRTPRGARAGRRSPDRRWGGVASSPQGNGHVSSPERAEGRGRSAWVGGARGGRSSELRVHVPVALDTESLGRRGVQAPARQHASSAALAARVGASATERGSTACTRNRRTSRR